MDLLLTGLQELYVYVAVTMPAQVPRDACRKAAY